MPLTSHASSALALAAEGVRQPDNMALTLLAYMPCRPAMWGKLWLHESERVYADRLVSQQVGSVSSRQT